MIIHPPRNKKKKGNLTKAQQALREQELKMLARHNKPLELGAKAKGLKVSITIAPPPAPPSRPPVDEAARWQAKMCGSTAPRTSQAYTGTDALGISNMHKSNAVPVFSKDAAIEIARMRRG